MIVENENENQTQTNTLPRSLSVTYSNNKEYRQAIRDFCHMNTIVVDFQPDTYDEETYDEWQYDMDAMKQSMDIIYEMTKENPHWNVLYLKAAGRFLSTHHEIGLSVLFSYDYFSKFVDCWNWFLEGKEFNRNTQCYITLHDAL